MSSFFTFDGNSTFRLRFYFDQLTSSSAEGAVGPILKTPKHYSPMWCHCKCHCFICFLNYLYAVFSVFNFKSVFVHCVPLTPGAAKPGLWLITERLTALRYKQRPWNQNLSMWREIYTKTFPLYFITAISLFSPLHLWRHFFRLLYECVRVSNLCVLVRSYVCGLTMLQTRTAVQFCGLKYNKTVMFVLIG